MRVLIKLGGTLLDSRESRLRLTSEITALANTCEVVVVHGGGKQMTRFLAERQIESRFEDGLRVSTPEVMDAVLKVLTGTVNHELLATFVAAGARPVGLSGIDAGLVECEPMAPALGAVGRPIRCDAGLIRLLAGQSYLPVVACVGGDRNGRVYNVNADQMAVSLAIGWQANSLYFFTDVDGVKNREGQVTTSLTAADCEVLIGDGVATGGMQAKLNAAVDALKAGIPEIVIAPGGFDGLLAGLRRGEAIGTRLVGGTVAAQRLRKEALSKRI